MKISEFDFTVEYEKTIDEIGFVEEEIHIAYDRKIYFLTKRILDIVISVFAIVLLFIPSVLISILIEYMSEGPIFYTQERLGQYGKPFNIIKFRSMHVGAEEKLGPVWSGTDDPRVTNFGKFLRRSHLDEIPQFINVLKGDMSIVGPRPERECFYSEFSKYIVGFDQRMLVPQGITGFAQAFGGLNLKPEEKIIYDLYYIKNENILMDLLIILKTIL